MEILEADRAPGHPPSRNDLPLHPHGEGGRPRLHGEAARRAPNVYVDTAARVPEFGRHPADKVRAFFIQFQDRILFGTDLAIGPKYWQLGSVSETPVGLEDAAFTCGILSLKKRSPYSRFYCIFGKWTGKSMGRNYPRYRAIKGQYLASKAGEFRKTGRLISVFSTRTKKEHFTGVSGRGRDPKSGKGAQFGLIFPIVSILHPEACFGVPWGWANRIIYQDLSPID